MRSLSHVEPTRKPPGFRGTASLVLLAGALATATVFGQGTQIGTASPAGDRGEVSHTNHVVQPGETLFSIAERYYGNGYEWVRLQEYNPWVDPDRLIVGSTIFVPEPRRGYSKGLFGGFDWGSVMGKSMTSKNPGVPGSGGGSGAGFLGGLSGVTCFGLTLPQILAVLMVWFLVHMAIQGTFVWFAAHMAFVKEVTFKKAMRVTFQSESLAMAFLLIVGLTMLLMIYVGTAPPGRPVLSELFSIVEGYLGTPTGIVVAGLVIVALYAFLGVRFVPPAFSASGGQGIAVVLISILIPHLLLLYLVGLRLGLIS